MSKIYRVIINTVDKVVPDKIRPFWEHPAGPKTIHFWAPLGKWGLVIAGLGDINRPAHLISMKQSGSLAITGLIWSRFAVTIIPKNYSLMTVNIFVALTAGFQCAKAAMYQMEHKDDNIDPKKK